MKQSLITVATSCSNASTDSRVKEEISLMCDRSRPYVSLGLIRLRSTESWEGHLRMFCKASPTYLLSVVYITVTELPQSFDIVCISFNTKSYVTFSRAIRSPAWRVFVFLDLSLREWTSTNYLNRFDRCESIFSSRTESAMLNLNTPNLNRVLVCAIQQTSCRRVDLPVLTSPKTSTHLSPS